MARLQNIGYSEYYELNTTTQIVIKDKVVMNEIKTSVKFTLLDQSERGDLIGIEVLSNEQTAKDPFFNLMADINQLNRYLVLETDINGNIVRLINYSDVINLWPKVKDDLRGKYGRSNEIETFLREFEKSLHAGEGPLLASMRYKGVYGVLFPGIYAFDRAPHFISRRTLKNYFNQVDLPMNVEVRLESQATPGQYVLNGKGILDADSFDSTEFQRLMRQIEDQFNLKVMLDLSYEEHYEIRQADGRMHKATQHLKAVVPGVYFNETRHSLNVKQ